MLLELLELLELFDWLRPLVPLKLKPLRADLFIADAFMEGEMVGAIKGIDKFWFDPFWGADELKGFKFMDWLFGEDCSVEKLRPEPFWGAEGFMKPDELEKFEDPSRGAE